MEAKDAARAIAQEWKPKKHFWQPHWAVRTSNEHGLQVDYTEVGDLAWVDDGGIWRLELRTAVQYHGHRIIETWTVIDSSKTPSATVHGNETAFTFPNGWTIRIYKVTWPI